MTAEVTLTGEQFLDLMAFGASFTIIEDAVQNIALVPIADEEVASFALAPEAFRLRISARLLELAESMRESLRHLDGRILQLTARD